MKKKSKRRSANHGGNGCGSGRAESDIASNQSQVSQGGAHLDQFNVQAFFFIEAFLFGNNERNERRAEVWNGYRHSPGLGRMTRARQCEQKYCDHYCQLARSEERRVGK